MMPLKLPQNFKYKFFFNASIPLSTNADVAPLHSSPFIFFKSNKSKAHVVVDGDFITFANVASISFNLITYRIDHIDLTLDERGEKMIVITKKKRKVEWELN
jgi:hypothetical protein